MEKKSFKSHTIIFTCFDKVALEDPEQWLKSLQAKCDWVMGQLEKCPTTQRIHIQGMAWAKENSRWGFLNGTNTWKKKCDFPIESIAYVSKGETRLDGPWEYGIRPTFNIKGQKLKNMEIINGNIAKLVEEDRIPIKGLKKLMDDINTYKIISNTEARSAQDNLWIVGEPGTGKSTYVRDIYPELYIKQQNKWWDGYTNEKNVLIDDFDHNGKCLSHLIKIWADRFDFIGESKGGSVKPIYDRLIVTSNYSIEEIWGGPDGDPMLVRAIYRRFRTATMDGYGKIKYID